MNPLILADIIAVVHVAYVMFVVFGLVIILIGKASGWGWVSNRWFRTIHLAMILIVVLRSWVMDLCPLTTWEDNLRAAAGQEDFEGSPVGWVCNRMIHPDVPIWVFPYVYTVFGLLVVATIWLVPVSWKRGTGAAGSLAGGSA